ncbi:MAG: YbhB/YbcL family Raf kinase inhibitor-like protein [candidate division Zixibacteria bacterium]|nr:YbhB/YbcL family Raf kinase inhibitor-like protein [candidate division Zixibacteria bacterium]
MAAGCSKEEDDNGVTDPTDPQLTLTSTAFESGATIPDLYTCEGTDISPQLQWSITNEPEGIVSFALIVDDPDAPVGTWVHWVFFNLPAATASLPEGTSPDGEIPVGCIEGINDFGNSEYGGPCPPTGQNHRYYFRLYALDTELDLTAGATRTQVDQAMSGHILVEGSLMGRYER